MRKLPTKCARTIAAELLEAIACRKILATVAMGSALFGLFELITSPSNAGGSLTRLAALALLVALGLAVYVACLELLGVVRLHDLLAAVRRL
jgi:peptidoglycan biosynthesis protein MviN/MurJ (putative lipid II flippase)